METVKFVEQCLNQVYERLMGSLKSLSQEDLSWRPAEHANSIGDILWHVARAGDRMATSATGQGPELWESQGWYKRLNAPREQSRLTDFQFLKAAPSPAPRLEDLVAYLEAIHQDALDKLRSLSASDLDRIPDPERPERSTASYFRHMITHTNNHHGQVDYIRGLMQPGWDLPPGTGVIQR